MNRTVDKGMFLGFIASHSNTKNEFAEVLGISKSHLHGIINGTVKVGNKTQDKIQKFIKEKGINFELEQLFKPLPLDGIESIVIYKEDGELVAAITSRETIIKDGYEMKCVPSDDVLS